MVESGSKWSELNQTVLVLKFVSNDCKSAEFGQKNSKLDEFGWKDCKSAEKGLRTVVWFE